MKLFCINRRKKISRQGFSLVEAMLSIGLLSASILTLAPLLAVGLKNAHSARNDEVAAQIAQTVAEEARQGTLPSGTSYVDDSGAACLQVRARYAIQAKTDSPATEVTRVTLRVTPVGAPDRSRIYAVMLPSQD